MSRFGRLRTTEDLFFSRLGAALTMELTVLDLVADLQSTAGRDPVWRAYAGIADDARRHVANVEASFRLAGKEPWERPCPAVDGLIKDGRAALRKAHDSLVDLVALTAARDVVGYGAATYETLAGAASALRMGDVVVLLRENLEDQQASARVVAGLIEQLAASGAVQYAG